MATRGEIESLLRATYAARQRVDLEGICRAFAPNARFQMAGSNASPVAVRVEGREQYWPLLAGMIRTFEISDCSILDMLVEGDKAAVRRRAEMRSAVAAQTVEAELLDPIEIENGRIKPFLEFCDVQ